MSHRFAELLAQIVQIRFDVARVSEDEPREKSEEHVVHLARFRDAHFRPACGLGCDFEGPRAAECEAVIGDPHDPP